MLGDAVSALLFLYHHLKAVFGISFLQYAFKYPLLLSEVKQIFTLIVAVRHQAYVVYYLAELRLQLSIMFFVFSLIVNLGHREEVG